MRHYHGIVPHPPGPVLFYFFLLSWLMFCSAVIMSASHEGLPACNAVRYCGSPFLWGVSAVPQPPAETTAARCMWSRKTIRWCAGRSEYNCKSWQDWAGSSPGCDHVIMYHLLQGSGCRRPNQLPTWLDVYGNTDHLGMVPFLPREVLRVLRVFPSLTDSDILTLTLRASHIHNTLRCRCLSGPHKSG